MFRTKKIRTALAAGAMTGALALTACAGGGGGGGETLDPNEEVTLDFAFWGNDVRAEMYDEAIAAFNEEYPNVEVNVSFLGFPEFWEKRQIEATSGGLPDVMQFDYSYLRQYADNGLLLDLGPHLGEGIDTDPLSEQIRDYEQAIQPRLGDAPPVPIVGYGTLEEKFRLLGTDLGLGVTTPEEAAAEFFGEMDVVLNQ